MLALGLVLAGAAPGGAQDGATQTYVVQKGDTLSKIARQFYGKASLGSRLWRANQNMVAHPNRLTPGDVIYIFPESTLALNTAVSVPPAPEKPSENLYRGSQLYEMAYPKFFSFVTDLQSRSATTRIHVKRKVPPSVSRSLDESAPKPGDVIDELYEARVVGEIIASSGRGAIISRDGFSNTAPGRLLLSTGDDVVVRFSEDISEILDSDTYDDADPYFNSFPVYSTNTVIQEPDRQRPDFGRSVGNLMQFKGKVHILARVEGLAPPAPRDVRKAKTRNRPNQDLEDVSYMARISYAEDAILMGDKVVLFVPLKPGPERRLDSPYVEPPDTYRAPGK
jgi:hypothetical protein